MAESEEELMRLLMRVKEGSEKVDLKLSFQKTKIMGGIWSHHFMANRMGKSGNWQILFWGAPISLQTVTAAMKLKDIGSLEGSYDKPR